MKKQHNGDTSRRKSKAEEALEWASRFDRAPMMRTPANIDDDDRMSAFVKGSEQPDDEPVTPGQVIDAFLAGIIEHVERLEQRIDYLLELVVQNKWIERPTSDESLDSLVESASRVFTRESRTGKGASQRVGFVVRDSNGDTDGGDNSDKGGE